MLRATRHSSVAQVDATTEAIALRSTTKFRGSTSPNGGVVGPLLLGSLRSPRIELYPEAVSSDPRYKFGLPDWTQSSESTLSSSASFAKQGIQQTQRAVGDS